MGTNILKIGLLITATQLLISSGCKRDSNGTKPCSTITPNSFNVTSEFSPQREVYKVGDTIFLNSSFPKVLLNNITNQQIDYSNAVGISGNITFSYFDTINRIVIDSYSNFNILTYFGSFNQIVNTPNAGINTNYFEVNLYNFKIGIICKSKGIYQFGVTDLYSSGLRGQNCTNANFNMIVINNNKNINLFQYALGYTPDTFLQKSIYCFRVI